MRISEFWRLADEEFGRAYARTLTSDLVLAPLDRTAEQAIRDGVAVRQVWEHLCDAMAVPQARRWGSDRRQGSGQGAGTT